MYRGGGSNSYYAVLGVGTEASEEEIRRAYRRLAMQWHPDKWSRSSPGHLLEAKTRFQQIQEAYSTLSDTRKRMLYDAGLHHLVDDEVEEFGDFLQEMVTLINDVRKQEKSYSIQELQSMFWEMEQEWEVGGGGMMGGSNINLMQSSCHGPSHFGGMMGGNSSQGNPHLWCQFRPR